MENCKCKSKLKDKALDRTLCRTCCGRAYGPVVRQTTQWMAWIRPQLIPGEPNCTQHAPCHCISLLKRYFSRPFWYSIKPRQIVILYLRYRQRRWSKIHRCQGCDALSTGNAEQDRLILKTGALQPSEISHKTRNTLRQFYLAERDAAIQNEDGWTRRLFWILRRLWRVGFFLLPPRLSCYDSMKFLLLLWRCIHRASSYNMYINQQDAQNSCD